MLACEYRDSAKSHVVLTSIIAGICASTPAHTGDRDT